MSLNCNVPLDESFYYPLSAASAERCGLIHNLTIIMVVVILR